MESLGAFKSVSANVLTDCRISLDNPYTQDIILDQTAVMMGTVNAYLTLLSDTWVASGATFDAIRQDIIDGWSSPTSETNGFDNVMQANLVVGDVERISDTVARVEFHHQAAYQITSTETWEFICPASALVTGSTPIQGSPSPQISTITTSATGHKFPINLVDTGFYGEKVRGTDNTSISEALIDQIQANKEGIIHFPDVGKSFSCKLGYDNFDVQYFDATNVTDASFFFEFIKVSSSFMYIELETAGNYNGSDAATIWSDLGITTSHDLYYELP